MAAKSWTNLNNRQQQQQLALKLKQSEIQIKHPNPTKLKMGQLLFPTKPHHHNLQFSYSYSTSAFCISCPRKTSVLLALLYWDELLLNLSVFRNSCFHIPQIHPTMHVQFNQVKTKLFQGLTLSTKACIYQNKYICLEHFKAQHHYHS